MSAGWFESPSFISTGRGLGVRSPEHLLLGVSMQATMPHTRQNLPTRTLQVPSVIFFSSSWVTPAMTSLCSRIGGSFAITGPVQMRTTCASRARETMCVCACVWAVYLCSSSCMCVYMCDLVAWWISGLVCLLLCAPPR